MRASAATVSRLAQALHLDMPRRCNAALSKRQIHRIKLGDPVIVAKRQATYKKKRQDQARGKRESINGHDICWLVVDTPVLRKQRGGVTIATKLLKCASCRRFSGFRSVTCYQIRVGKKFGDDRKNFLPRIKDREGTLGTLYDAWKLRARCRTTRCKALNTHTSASNDLPSLGCVRCTNLAAISSLMPRGRARRGVWDGPTRRPGAPEPCSLFERGWDLAGASTVAEKAPPAAQRVDAPGPPAARGRHLQPEHGRWLRGGTGGAVPRRAGGEGTRART